MTFKPLSLAFKLISILSMVQISQSGSPFTRQSPLEWSDCKFTSEDGARYDFTSLIPQSSWPLNITTDRSTPPTLTIETLLISLCTELKPVEEGCPAGTTVCLSIFNESGEKGGTDRRLISRIPIAGPSRPVVQGGGLSNRDPIRLTIAGGTYNGVQQSTVFNFACATSAAAPRQPKTQYDTSKGFLTIDWPTPLACASASGSPVGTPTGSSGWFGSFVTFIIFIFIAYFLIGIWLNYNKYGGNGWDLIPHQDFWRELPRMISELFRSRRGNGSASRAGYSAI
ncbi:uncharacterized protein MELLADRAFT_105799 [Melampsora larici-populina 98AG31]|uniref:Autophagy-related protein 27 n=1 Tax=Melampsora larici-populina (strain 98AG31 / pathotype 3-4-7) TaxID=747676 RepID=F4RJD5_MELLP|nr:uncharacterized protein MELLADRAFT_105799 [Melampsora larici-populina 98AG31]EGG07295.1 hypothetical protein MELLADRAFT_105799 [Melampsora larici-populina 98AG31]